VARSPVPRWLSPHSVEVVTKLHTLPHEPGVGPRRRSVASVRPRWDTTKTRVTGQRLVFRVNGKQQPLTFTTEEQEPHAPGPKSSAKSAATLRESQSSEDHTGRDIPVYPLGIAVDVAADVVRLVEPVGSWCPEVVDRWEGVDYQAATGGPSA
jgi:hypothetical protein